MLLINVVDQDSYKNERTAYSSFMPSVLSFCHKYSAKVTPEGQTSVLYLNHSIITREVSTRQSKISTSIDHLIRTNLDLVQCRTLHQICICFGFLFAAFVVLFFSQDIKMFCKIIQKFTHSVTYKLSFFSMLSWQYILVYTCIT